MSWLWAIVTLINNLFSAFKLWRAERALEEKRQTEERNQKRDDAVDHSKTDETDDEIWKSQDDIVKNRPRP